MSDEIQTNRYDQILRRVAGIIGPGSKVSQVITELFPMINVEDLPAELLRLGGTRLCFGGGQVNPVAAESPTAQLFNPPDSNMLITITRVDIGMFSDSIIRWGVATLQRGSRISTEKFRDTRDFPPNLPVGQISQDSAVALASGTCQSQALAKTPFTLWDPNAVAVLVPGTGFEIGLQIVNASLNHGFQWRERPALESELNL